MVRFARQIYQKLKQFDPLFFPQFVRELPNKTAGINRFSTSQEKILLITEKCRKISMTELATVLGVTKPTVTALVDKLILSGYVLRVSDPEDRRRVKIALTRKGKSELSQTRKLQAKRIIKWLEGLTEGEQEEFFRHAEGMNRLLEKLKITGPNFLRLLSWMTVGFLVSSLLMQPAFAGDAAYNPISVQILNETNKESEESNEKIIVPTEILPFDPESKKRMLALGECLEIGFVYHPSIQRAFADIARAKARVGRAWAPQLPQMSADAAFERIFQRNFDNVSIPANRVVVTSREMTFTGSLLTWDFGRTFDQVSKAKHDVLRTRADAQTLFDKVLVNVRKAYFEVVRAQEALIVSEETLAQNKERLRQIKGFYEVGRRPRFDVTSQEVEVENAELALIRAQNALQINKETLNNSMGVHIPFDYVVESTQANPNLEIKEHEAIALALGNRPEITSFREQLKGQEKEISQLRKAYFPTVSGIGSVELSDTSYIDPLRTYTFGFQSNWNIFDGMAIWHQITEAKELYRSISADQRQQLLDVVLETAQAFFRLQEASQRIKTSDKLYQFAEETLESAEERYRTGIGNIIELRDSQLDLTNAKNERVAANADYQIAEADLDRAIGLRLRDIKRRGE